MVTPEHVAAGGVEPYCTAESAKDRDRGCRCSRPTPRTRTRSARRSTAASTRSARSSTPARARWTSTSTRPRRRSSSATRRWSFLEVHVGHGAERLAARRRSSTTWCSTTRVASPRCARSSIPRASPRPRVNPPDDVYTHGHHESVLRSHRWRTAENSAGYLLDALTPGTRVLDVGCGPGTITIDFAQRVAPAEVVGIDREPTRCSKARRDAARDAGVDTVELRRRRRVRARRSPTRRSTSCTRTRCCSTSPIRSPRCARCAGSARPDGVVAARDSDYAAFTWFPEDPRLTRWLELYHEVARSNDAEPDAGRHLLAVGARAAGFSRRVDASASVWCFATRPPTGRGGVGCGPTGSWRRRSPTQAVDARLRDA